jgi:hypothetical protein
MMPACGDPELLLLVRRARELIYQLDAIENDLWHLWQCSANPGERCTLAGVWQRDQGAWRSITACRGTQNQALGNDFQWPGCALSGSLEEGE